LSCFNALLIGLAGRAGRERRLTAGDVASKGARSRTHINVHDEILWDKK
jgi:hypothetical protein